MFVVAGATGHVGSVVVNELLAHGEKVKVLLRDSAKRAQWSKKGIDVAVADLGDAASLAGALEGSAGFFTLLPPSYEVREGFISHQHKTADAIASAVKRSKVPHVVILSSVGGDLPDGNGPIKALHYFENALRETGVKLTVIRSSYFQENAGNTLALAKAQGIFPNMTPSADYAFPMIATRDIGVVAAHELMFPPEKSEVVDLRGPAYSTRQVADKLGTALGKKLQVVDVSPADQAKAYQQGGMSAELADLFAEMNAGFATGKILPHGDRLIQGRTPIDTVIKRLTSG
jgi:uncharacterized protein YbjT (DUF2867 family)